MTSETNLDKLTINYLTEEQYQAAKEEGTLNENELYCTPDDSDEKLRQTIFEGVLKGGQSIVLPNAKRFLDIYFYINIDNGDVGFGGNKYTIDTATNNITFSGTTMPAFDVDTGRDYYVSESKFVKSTNTLTHTKIGFYNIGGSYTSRNNNNTYLIYRIDTYN